MCFVLFFVFFLILLNFIKLSFSFVRHFAFVIVGYLPCVTPHLPLLLLMVVHRLSFNIVVSCYGSSSCVSPTQCRPSHCTILVHYGSSPCVVPTRYGPSHYVVRIRCDSSLCVAIACFGLSPYITTTCCGPLPCTIVVCCYLSPCTISTCCVSSPLPCVATACCGSFPTSCIIIACCGASPSSYIVVTRCDLSFCALHCFFIISKYSLVFPPAYNVQVLELGV